MRSGIDLERLRGVGDPPVDLPLQSWLETRAPEELDELVDDLFRSSTVADTLLARNDRGSLADVLRQPLPAWADERKIDVAHEFFAVHGLTAYLNLATGSLPATYVDESIAQVLSISGELLTNVPRRLAETSRMVLDVMEAGGLATVDPLSPGLETGLRVRLLHSTMRYLIRLGSGARTENGFGPRMRSYALAEWRQPQVPINQLDLITTMLTFSYVIIKGWRETGVPCTDEIERAYIHTWNVIGHVIGIQLAEGDYPSDYVEAERLFEACIQTAPPHEAERSIALTRRLYAFIGDVGGVLGRPLFPLLTYRVLGKERAERLQVERPTGLAGLYARALLVVVRLFSNKLAWVYTRLPFLSVTFGLSRFGRDILERFSAAQVLEIGDAVRRRRRLRDRKARPGAAETGAA